MLEYEREFTKVNGLWLLLYSEKMRRGFFFCVGISVCENAREGVILCESGCPGRNVGCVVCMGFVCECAWCE